MGAWECIVHPFGLFIQRLIEKDHLTGAIRTTEHFAPDSIFNTPPGFAIGVKRLIHPAEFTLNFVKQLPPYPHEGIHVER
jgi:hypothetical protein